jgi:hypothetical protein
MQRCITWTTVAYTLITLLGVGVSIAVVLVTLREAHEDRLIALAALREAQVERRERFTPYLAFEGGGHQFPIKFVRIGLSVPGVDPDYAKNVLAFLPNDGESVDLKPHKDSEGRDQLVEYGHLRNFGLGPALETLVTFVPEEITTDQDTHVLSPDEIKDARYSVELNKVPSLPEHIAAGDTAKLSRIPSFIVKDFEKRLRKVRGYFLINCKDVYGGPHSVKQNFYIRTGYDEATPVFHITFGDLRTYAEPGVGADSR